jgi:hypothetical protein
MRFIYNDAQNASTSCAIRSGCSTQCQCPHASSTFSSFLDVPTCSRMYLHPSKGADLSSAPARMHTGTCTAAKSGSWASTMAWQCDAYAFGSEPRINSRTKARVRADDWLLVAAVGTLSAIGSMPSTQIVSIFSNEHYPQNALFNTVSILALKTSALTEPGFTGPTGTMPSTR